jgi:hypothetical protein
MTSLAAIDLSGVGPVLAARLNALGLFTTHDLLRTDRRRLDQVLDGASVAQIRRWQAVAELLEVDGMSLPLAEGLHARGLETLDELAGSSLTRLRSLVGAMRSEGIPGADASDDVMVGWMKDALLLRHTGTLNGTVTGAGSAPLGDVAVKCMGKRAVSDARGRFRIRRLPLGRELIVHLQHPDHLSKTVPTTRVAAPGVLLGERFRLSRRPATSPPGPQPAALSELRGDRMPSLSGASIAIRVQDEAPAEHDLLRVVELPDAGGARAVSRLLDYEAGGFVVRSYRLPADVLAPGAGVGDHLRFSDGRWRVTALPHGGIQAVKRRLRLQRLRPPLPPNPTVADIDRAMRDFIAALARERGR